MVADNREDCYFFLHGGCNKGTLCPFRHSEDALKTINVCTDWMETKICKADNCVLRHSTYHISTPINKQKDPRGEVPCYWEQNGGCKSYRCPFFHSMPKVKSTNFQQFRPVVPPAPTPLQYSPGAKMFIPRPQTFPSHHQTLILNNPNANIIPHSTTALARPEKVNEEPKPTEITHQPAVNRTSYNGISTMGVQIKNISSGPAKHSNGHEVSQAPISFKSSNSAQDSRPPQQKSVFDRLSNQKNYPGSPKQREFPNSKRSTKATSPKQSPGMEAQSTPDSFKVKSLEEILREKRKRQAAQSDSPSPSIPSKSIKLDSRISSASQRHSSSLNSEPLPDKVQVPVKSTSPPSNATKPNNSGDLGDAPNATSKALTPPADSIDDEFGSDFEDLDYMDTDGKLLDLEFDNELADL